jgi:exosome complex component RRP40
MPSELKVVLPGDLIPAADENGNSQMEMDDEAPVVRLGPGLTQVQEDIVSMKAGVLKHQETGNKWWLESNQRRVSATLYELSIHFYILMHSILI